MGFIQYIAWFRELNRESIPTAGGKGANLGEIFKANFPVPPGFVVTAQAYFDFIESTGIKQEIVEKIDAIDVENTLELQNTSQEIRELITSTPINQRLKDEIKKSYMSLGERPLLNLTTAEESFVAVRSSATAEDLPTASFAGMQETFLNVRGTQQVWEAVKKCWASLFNQRAIYYRKKQGFGTEKVGIAVIVQKMVNSEIAGIVFTAEPQTADSGKIVIEAAFGLGEAVVSGSLTPDTYTISKLDFKILEKKVAKQEWKLERSIQGNQKITVAAAKQGEQKLSDEKIMELARLARMVEQHYASPQDIEFAIEEGKIYLVQTRAITTMGLRKRVEEEKEIESKEKPVLKGLAASPGIATGIVKVILTAEGIGRVGKGDIIATVMTSPDWVPAMQKAIAIITDEGGTTSHAAIVSRELGIPCVVGTEQGTKLLKDGETITVDGFRGVVYEGKVKLEEEKKKKVSKKEIEEEQSRLQEFLEQAKEEEEAKEFALEAAPDEEIEKIAAIELLQIRELLNEVKVKVKVNVALPEAAGTAAETGADGVGLLRAEHLITESGIHPAEFLRQGKKEELVQAVKKGIKAVAEKFEGKQVWYRTFDARTDEYRNLQGGEEEPKEDNPMLGWHGIRRDLDEPELLKAQFQAVKELRDEGVKNVGIMLPFVINAEELKKAKEIAVECGLKPLEEIEFGIMVETPAAVFIIEEFIQEGISFISFGTNDLTQLTLGIDRNNERIQKHFTELHSAVLKQCAFAIQKCKRKGIETSICGQAGSNPEMVKWLVRLGISSVSANIDAVEEIRKVVLQEEKELLKRALERMKNLEE